MKRRSVIALGALTLGRMGSAAPAAEPVGAKGKPEVKQVAPAKVLPETAQVMPAVGSLTGAPDVCCDPCCDCCPGGPFGGNLVAGVGFYLLQPFWGSNKAYVQVVNRRLDPNVVGDRINSAHQEDFDFGYDWAPRVWFGWQGEGGLGVRVRWWEYQQENALPAINASGPPGTSQAFRAAVFSDRFGSPGVGLNNHIGDDLLNFEAEIDLDVWDFEAIQDATLGDWAFLLCGGVRYVHLAQDYHARRTNVGGLLIGPGVVEFVRADYDVLRSGHNFNGAGPTVAVEARRPLGDSGFILVGNARGSALFGHEKRTADLLAVRDYLVDGERSTTSSLVNANSSRDGFLPIAELEVGGEYSFNLGTWRMFIQAMLVGQTWFGAGSPSKENGDLSFFGTTVTAGINY